MTSDLKQDIKFVRSLIREGLVAFVFLPMGVISRYDVAAMDKLSQEDRARVHNVLTRLTARRPFLGLLPLGPAPAGDDIVLRELVDDEAIERFRLVSRTSVPWLIGADVDVLSSQSEEWGSSATVRLNLFLVNQGQADQKFSVEATIGDAEYQVVALRQLGDAGRAGAAAHEASREHGGTATTGDGRRG